MSWGASRNETFFLPFLLKHLIFIVLWVLFYFGSKIESGLNALPLGAELGSEGRAQRTVIFLTIHQKGTKRHLCQQTGSQLPPQKKV